MSAEVRGHTSAEVTLVRSSEVKLVQSSEVTLVSEVKLVQSSEVTLVGRREQAPQHRLCSTSVLLFLLLRFGTQEPDAERPQNGREWRLLLEEEQRVGGGAGGGVTGRGWSWRRSNGSGVELEEE
ncbi:unnamed protein product [Arctogadus glacialis]